MISFQVLSYRTCGQIKSRIPEKIYRGTTMKIHEYVNKFYPLLVRYRRSISAILAGLGVMIIISFLAPKPGVEVLVASKDLAAGSKLTAQDFTTGQIEENQLWSTVASSSDQLVGKTLARPLAINQPISASDLVGSSLLAGLPANYVAISLPVHSSTNFSLLSPGAQVDIYTASTDGLNSGILVASRAIILSTSSAANSTMFSASNSATGIIVAVDSVAAIGVAGNMISQGFTVALLPTQ
jgi:Flp pilus assembly protein CpaB